MKFARLRLILGITGVLAALLALGWLALQPGPLPPAPHPVSVAVTPPPAVPIPPQYEEPIGPLIPPAQPPVTTHTKSGPPRVALVIDDCGLSVAQTAPVLDLPAPVTLTFLPYGAATARLAAAAEARGHTVFLHMPMQPVGHDNPGPGALVPGQGADEAQRRLTDAIALVPGATGVNNHMGSAATADTALMQAIMPVLAARGLPFLDSYTSAKSVAYAVARTAGVAAARRDVFLDDTVDRAAIDGQLQRLTALAERRGQAIAIGHPHPETLAALRAWLVQAKQRGIVLVPVTDLMEQPR